MKYRTLEAAIENIQRSFVNTPEDMVSVDDIFKTWGRDLTKIEENRAWLSNKLTHWKYHSLVKPIYDYKSGHRVLEKIQLTLQGKRAIGRINDEIDKKPEANGHNGSSSIVTSTDLAEMVAKFQEQNPKFEVTFKIELKSV